jgi:hypothetical protein
MPALPWIVRHPIDPTKRYLAMASRLPLKSYGFVPGFLRDAMRIRRQLADTPGLLGYGLDAQLARKCFWTFSVWEDQASLDAFAGTEPHLGITRRLKPRMEESCFEFLSVSGDSLPMTWEQMKAPVNQ